jgi:hypothetical protein
MFAAFGGKEKGVRDVHQVRRVSEKWMKRGEVDKVAA